MDLPEISRISRMCSGFFISLFLSSKKIALLLSMQGLKKLCSAVVGSGNSCFQLLRSLVRILSSNFNLVSVDWLPSTSIDSMRSKYSYSFWNSVSEQYCFLSSCLYSLGSALVSVTGSVIKLLNYLLGTWPH